MKQIITAIVVVIVLIRTFLMTDDMMTKIIIIPFIVFAMALAIKNALVMMDKKSMADKFRKVYTVAFLVYGFGFLMYWDYVSFIDGDYIRILFSIPCWLVGFYFTYKRLIKK